MTRDMEKLLRWPWSRFDFFGKEFKKMLLLDWTTPVLMQPGSNTSVTPTFAGTDYHITQFMIFAASFTTLRLPLIHLVFLVWPTICMSGSAAVSVAPLHL